MSLITIGTTLTTSMQGLVVPSQSNGAITHFSATDIGNFNNLMKSDTGVHRIEKGGFRANLLHVPGRGTLTVKPGDYVCVDANGWPILVSAYSIATGGWTHT